MPLPARFNLIQRTPGAIGKVWPGAVSLDYQVQLENFGAEQDQTGAIVIALVIFALGPGTRDPVWAGDLGQKRIGAVAISADGSVAGETAADLKAFVALVESAITKVPTWALALSYAQRISALNQGNIKGYFAEAGMDSIKPKPILKVITLISHAVCNGVSDADFRDALDNSPWITYHTSACSTPGLCVRMIEGLRGMPWVSDASERAVRRAVDAHSSLEATAVIPKTVLVMTHAYLAANNVLPENWYQGEKAIAEFPPSQYKAMLEVMKALSRVSYNAQQVAEAASAEAVFQAAPVYMHEV